MLTEREEEYEEKSIVITLVLLTGIAITGCGISEKLGDFATNVINEEIIEEKESNDDLSNEQNVCNPDGSLVESRLTDDEKKIIGVWESEQGDTLAIRERKLNDGDQEDFHLDAIVYYFYYDEEVGNLMDKITRQDESYFYEEDGKLILTDTFDCTQDGQEPGSGIDTHVFVYDEETDTITQTFETVDGLMIMEITPEGEVYSKTYSRTDRDIESVDWDQYYETVPNRDPR